MITKKTITHFLIFLSSSIRFAFHNPVDFIVQNTYFPILNYTHEKDIPDY